MSLTPGALWRVGNVGIPASSYDCDIDDEWYPLSFFTEDEMLFIIQCEPGIVHNLLFRPPESLTTVFTVISSNHGITHTCEFDIINCCELVGAPNNET